MIGFALVALVLFAFLNNWRSALISIVSIMVSILAAGLVLYVAGVEVNMMIFTGLLIALAVLVDDSVIDVENVTRRLRQHRQQAGSEESISWIIREATIEMRGVILYATLISLLAMAPVFFMEGLYGAFLQPLAFMYAFAVIVSVVVAMTLTPTLSILLLPNDLLSDNNSGLAHTLRNAYDSTVAPILNKPGLAFAAIVLIVVAGAMVAPRLRQESLFPTFKEMDLVVELDGKAGTSQPAMSRITRQVSRNLRTVSGVKNVSAHIGRAVMSDEVADVNNGEIWVSIDPTADYDATVAALNEVVNSYSGLDREVRTYIDERINQELQGEEQGVVVRVYGEDMQVLRSKALEVRDMLARIDGIVDPVAELPVEEPTVEIEPDLAKCQKYGLKPGDVRRAAAVLLSGIEVGSLFEEQKVFDVVVWGAPSIRGSLTDVNELLIDTPSGDHVALGEVAEIRVVPAPTNITREAVARYIDVGAQIRGRDLASIARDVKHELRQVNFPMEFRAELLGAPFVRLEAQQRLRGFAIAALIGIFLLLQAAFASWRLAILVFLTLPLALVGGLVAMYAGGGLISIGSVAGLVAVFAVATRSSVMLVCRYQQLVSRHDDKEADPHVAQFQSQSGYSTVLNGDGRHHGPISLELVQSGTRDRLVPILMTAAATALLFAPAAYFGNISGNEIAAPMAVVVLGGLVTSTLLSLYILPALYLWLKAEPAPDIVTESINVDEAVELT